MTGKGDCDQIIFPLEVFYIVLIVLAASAGVGASVERASGGDGAGTSMVSLRDYQLGEVLYTGAETRVRRAVHRASDARVVLRAGSGGAVSGEAGEAGLQGGAALRPLRGDDREDRGVPGQASIGRQARPSRASNSSPSFGPGVPAA